jgi:hypothetical protein
MFGLSALGGDLPQLQRRLGVSQTDRWDTATLQAIATYQGRSGQPLEMHVTGVPDPATLINLGYYDPVSELPRRQADYLAGNTEPPMTFWRDTATISNQVPQWIWIVAGAGMLGVGYYIYRKNRREEKGQA